MSLTPEQIADVIRIVERAEVLSNTDGEKPRVTALSLRVPREQTPPPAEERPSCARRNCGHVYIAHRTSDGHCVIEGCGCSVYLEMFPPSAPASADPKCTRLCLWGGGMVMRPDPACPVHGKPAEPAAEDDEAWRIAVSQCHTRYNALRCAEDIRALVAEREAAARTVERKAAFAFVEHLPEVHYIRKHFAGQLDEACADAIEREGGKGR